MPRFAGKTQSNWPACIACNSPDPGIFFVDIGPGVQYNRKMIMGVLLCLADDKDAHRLIEKGEMMKSVSLRRVVLTVILGVFFLLPGGCSSYEQPGETAAEGRRRHLRNARINQQELMADTDKFMQSDKPSELTEKRIP